MDGMNEQVRLRAYELWQMSGMTHGREIEHWTMAEHEIRTRLGETAPAKAKKKTTKTVAASATKPRARKAASSDAIASH
jgi:hypothetical protein